MFQRGRQCDVERFHPSAWQLLRAAMVHILPTQAGHLGRHMQPVCGGTLPAPSLPRCPSVSQAFVPATPGEQPATACVHASWGLPDAAVAWDPYVGVIVGCEGSPAARQGPAMHVPARKAQPAATQHVCSGHQWQPLCAGLHHLHNRTGSPCMSNPWAAPGMQRQPRVSQRVGPHCFSPPSSFAVYAAICVEGDQGAPLQLSGRFLGCLHEAHCGRNLTGDSRQASILCKHTQQAYSASILCSGQMPCWELWLAGRSAGGTE
jgi:hypothetical protein